MTCPTDFCAPSDVVPNDIDGSKLESARGGPGKKIARLIPTILPAISGCALTLDGQDDFPA